MMKWGFVSAVILFSVQRAMSVVLVFGEQSFFSSAWNFSFNNTFFFYCYYFYYNFALYGILWSHFYFILDKFYGLI